MKRLRNSVIAAVLTAAGVTLVANAAAAIDLTVEERKKLHKSLTAMNVSGPPNEWTPEVGGSVPDAVKLYTIPPSIKIIKVVRYRYALDNDTVVLADPLTREIVELIGKDDLEKKD